ncbi:uncharacterized protein G2W53_027079 [Senna tora]|uniref:Uncharacterized protein n=1 Tax=Senna tora TaxID=362788 RepID=A0A834TQ64_9FABA|nr:uncharacterized protein G2W53_027079 [Senna tora]
MDDPRGRPPGDQLGLPRNFLGGFLVS